MPRSQISIVAAPIGDYLSDFSVGGLRTLEKTRHLFLEADDHFASRLQQNNVIKPHHVVHYFEGREDDCLAEAVALIEAGTDMALLMSSGIPGFVDPGWQIPDWIFRNNALDQVDLHVIGMSSALDGALALCGLNVHEFAFAGHYPEQYTLEELAVPGHFPIFYFVRGQVLSAFVDAAMAHFSPPRLVLFRDLRKKGLSQIQVIDAGAPRPTLVDDVKRDYVCVLYPRR